MDGNAPWGGQTPPPPSSPQMPMQNAGSAPPPPWPPQPVAQPPRRLLVPIGVAVAVLLSAAALVVSLVKGSGDTSSAPTQTPTAKAEPTQVFVDDADRDVWQARGA